MRQKKAQDQKFTQRKFIKQAGLPENCSSLLPAVIKGRRKLSQPMVVKFAKAMGLGEREYDYFENLVKFSQAKTMAEKNH